MRVIMDPQQEPSKPGVPPPYPHADSNAPHRDQLKPGGPHTGLRYPLADQASPYAPYGEQSKSRGPHPGQQCPQADNPPYGIAPGLTQHDGVMNPGFIGSEVHHQYPYNPHLQPYIVQQVQGQPNMILHHAVAQDHQLLYSQPPPPYVQQAQPTFVVKAPEPPTTCGRRFSYRKFLIGVFFALLISKFILIGIMR